MTKVKRFALGLLLCCGATLLNCKLASASNRTYSVNQISSQQNQARVLPNKNAVKKPQPIKNYTLTPQTPIRAKVQHDKRVNVTTYPQQKSRSQMRLGSYYRENNTSYHKKYNVYHLTNVNYYTRIGIPYGRHNPGYGVYSTPYGASNKASSFQRISSERQLDYDPVHVIQTAISHNRTWLHIIRHHLDGWMNENGTMQNITRWLNVPLISQRPQLPTGCEITATTMMLKYRGANVNKMKLAREMPRSWNPNRGFVGSPYSVYGWYIFPQGLMGLVNRYTHHNALNMTWWSEPSIIRQINRGIPVVMWVADLDGFVNHAITIYGYTYHDLLFNDPWLNERRAMNVNRLWYLHELDNDRALSYRK